MICTPAEAWESTAGPVVTADDAAAVAGAELKVGVWATFNCATVVLVGWMAEVVMAFSSWLIVQSVSAGTKP
ncbi:hypothetical protein D3C71_1344490 [compost metagenome]